MRQDMSNPRINPRLNARINARPDKPSWQNRGLLIMILITLILIFSFGCKTQADTEGKVCYGDTCFNVEVVSTPETRAVGLMYREEMEEDRGMLFVFQESAVYSFWMKNTLIPLDMIWMDPYFNVVHIAENVQPCRADLCPVTNPGVEALYVLELNAGTASKIGLKVGDSLTPDSNILAGADYLQQPLGKTIKISAEN